MCTLTILRCDAASGSPYALRVECNRDESRLRPPARPPEMRVLGPRRAVMPVDPVSEGTWIGASDAPLVAVLMNVYARPLTREDLIALAQPTGRPPSRGTIVPHVLAADDLDAALDRATTLDHARYDSFRLVLADASSYAQVVWSEGRFEVTPAAPITRPLFFTSSGLGDEIVADPRRVLFEVMLGDRACDAAAQDAFHRHVWPGREFASVWMTRAEARTVSITTIELGLRSLRLDYESRAEEDPSAATLAPAVAASFSY